MNSRSCYPNPVGPMASPLVPHRCKAHRRISPGPKRPKGLYSTRAWKLPALLDAVRTFLQDKRARGGHLITVEEVARTLRAKPGPVTGCFHKLTEERIIGHKMRFGPVDGCWWPNVYTLLSKPVDK